MKKILFIVTQSEMGGAQRYIYEVAKALAERHEVLIAAGEGDGELFEKISKSKIQNPKLQLKTQNLKYLKRAPNPYILIAAMAEIRRVLKKEKPDVLFLCSTTAGLLGSIAARIYRGPTSRASTSEVNATTSEVKREVGPQKMRVIYRIGGWAFNDPRPFWKNWLIFWAEKLTARFKDLIIVNSEYDRRIAIEKKIISPAKIVKIYNGIDMNSLSFLPREEARRYFATRYQIPDTRYQIGCVANFYKTKGLEYLIEAVSRLSLPGRLSLVIIGDGKERLRLEVLIKKYGLENIVILTGRIPDAYKYLKAFDVFALPSLKEGFPWVILEAAAAGIPIVATKVGAISEILPEEFLVEPKNAEALANKIRQMLEHPVLPKLKQEFSIKKMIEETENAMFNVKG